jgi:hypothetical protein
MNRQPFVDFWQTELSGSDQPENYEPVDGLACGAFCTLDRGTDITSVRATIVVPPAPTTFNPLKVYLFPALQTVRSRPGMVDPPLIIQPVLQWDNKKRGWSVITWYLKATREKFVLGAFTEPTDVEIGDELHAYIIRLETPG